MPDRGNAEALCEQGNKFHLAEQLDKAIASYRRAIAIKPEYVEAHGNLGVALQKQGKLAEAIACYRKVLQFSPDIAETHYNLGDALWMQGRLDEAEGSYRKATALNPAFASAYNNLGTVLKEQGRLDKAIDSFRMAIALKPDYAKSHYNLGVVLQRLRQFAGAEACYLKALEINPGYVEAHNNLGNVLEAQGNLGKAVESYYRVLSFRPDNADAYSNLLFLHGYQASLAPRDYLAMARGWEQACVPAQVRQLAGNRTFIRPPLAGRRLRVGYVSGDYSNHAVSYFVEQIFTFHDQTRVEVFAYSTASLRDAVTERLQALTDHWIPITGMPDSAVLDRIEADGIDVLVDLSGHTAYNRMGVFARRAAPVQLHYLGFVASTGLTEMDYFIGDDILTPPQADSHFSEQVWRLPRVWVSYDGKADAPTPDWYPAGDGAVWLGSFNNLGKITPATLALWAEVLHVLPEGKLLLKTKELADAGNRQRILDAMDSHGIAAGRVELQPSSITPGWQEHMAYYNRLDIALDPVGGVGGGTTTCDALWMGVPLITLEGDRMASRMTASMLNAIGHPEWVAGSEAEYVDKVVALVRDVQLRTALRPAQRGRMAASPLCDARDLVKNLERAYIGMFGQSRRANNTVLA